MVTICGRQVTRLMDFAILLVLRVAQAILFANGTIVNQMGGVH